MLDIAKIIKMSYIPEFNRSTIIVNFDSLMRLCALSTFDILVI